MRRGLLGGTWPPNLSVPSVMRMRLLYLAAVRRQDCRGAQEQLQPRFRVSLVHLKREPLHQQQRARRLRSPAVLQEGENRKHLETLRKLFFFSLPPRRMHCCSNQNKKKTPLLKKLQPSPLGRLRFETARREKAVSAGYRKNKRMGLCYSAL